MTVSTGFQDASMGPNLTCSGIKKQDGVGRRHECVPMHLIPHSSRVDAQALFLNRSTTYGSSVCWRNCSEFRRRLTVMAS
jgi:hypothetical protein